MVAHHLVARSKGGSSLDRDREVLQTVRVERVAVPPAPVEFEGDDTVDDDVDAAEVLRADPGLGLDAVPQVGERHPHDALDEALAPWVGPVDDAPHIRGSLGEGHVQSGDREVTARQRPVQEGDGLVERSHRHGVHQSGADGNGPGRTPCVLRSVFVVIRRTGHRPG